MSSFPMQPTPGVPVEVTVSPASGTVELGSNSLQLTGEILDAYGTVVEGSLSWESSNPSLATVDDTGLVTSAAIADPNALQTGGQVTVTAAYPFGENTLSVYAVVFVTVPEAYSGHVVILSSGKDGYPQSGNFGEVSVFPNQPYSGGSPVIGG